MPNQSIDKEKQKEKKKLQRQFEELEQKTAQLKEEKLKVESDLANPEIYSNVSKFQETEKKYNKIIAELTSAESQYEKAFELLMSHE
jgi:ATP-binding cassette subfamily F protein 3